MKWMGVATAGLLLAGCQTTAESDLADAKASCQAYQSNFGKPGSYRSMDDCIMEEARAYRMIRTAAATAPQPSAGYSAPWQQPMPNLDQPAQPSPNILPQTVRCQSVPAGMGTVQTVCR